MEGRAGSSVSMSLCHSHRRSAAALQCCVLTNNSLLLTVPESEVMLPMKLEVHNCDCSTARSRDGQPASGHHYIARAQEKTT